MNKYDLAYIAGLFDGEACITLTRRHRKMTDGFQPQVIFSITDKQTVQWIYEQFNFGYFTEKKRLTSGGYRVYTFGTSSINDTKQLLEMIMPYLKVKLQIARLVYKWIINHKIAPRGKARKHRTYQTPDWEFQIFDKIHLFTQKRSSLRI